MRMTRRRLLTAAGTAAAVSALQSPPLARAATDALPLPPALKADVFRERQAKLRAAAKARGLDVLFVTPSTNLAYAANLALGRSERLTALLLFADGPAVLLTPSFEEANHKRACVADDIKTWQEDDDPIALAAKLVSGRKTIGVEGSTNYATVTALSQATSAKIEDGTSLFDALRMIKSEEEQVFIQDAARRTNLAIERTHKQMRAGMIESEVSRILEDEFRKQGVRGEGLVQFGPSSAFPHGAPAERRLAKGNPVLIDCGCKVRGYNSDITRTVSFGPPSDEFRKVYATVDRAQMAGIEALRAGAAAEDVDRAARKVIEDGGYGKYFTHRVGHGLGMDGHEQPYLVHGNKKPLAVGNVETVEPGIYIPDHFGVRIEDDYAVRSTGAASLSVRPGAMVVLNA